jgi:hypothetical protein
MATYCIQSHRHFGSKCYALVILRDHSWSAQKITDTQTLGKYVEWDIFIVSNLCLSLSWTAADASYDDALYDDVSRPSISM